MTLTQTQQVGKPDDWVGTHITFRCQGILPWQKTNRWTIWTRQEDANFLGEVRWFGRWRKYCFFPAGSCVFEEVCMREIADFIVARSKEQRAK